VEIYPTLVLRLVGTNHAFLLIDLFKGDCVTTEHGTQPSRKPRRKPSQRVDDMERKRGETLPPRDSTTRMATVTKKHWQEEKESKK
jgi:hypothetical protein